MQMSNRTSCTRPDIHMHSMMSPQSHGATHLGSLVNLNVHISSVFIGRNKQHDTTIFPKFEPNSYPQIVVHVHAEVGNPGKPYTIVITPENSTVFNSANLAWHMTNKRRIVYMCVCIIMLNLTQ